jgi:hypothetical protein
MGSGWLCSQAEMLKGVERTRDIAEVPGNHFTEACD